MLGKVLFEKRMISSIKDDKEFAFWHLFPDQKARSLYLLDLILRNLTILDDQINLYLTKKPFARVINILRIAAAEIFLDKIATYAVVDCAVRLTKSDKRSIRFSGLVNAVCRKFVKKRNWCFKKKFTENYTSNARRSYLI